MTSVMLCKCKWLVVMLLALLLRDCCSNTNTNTTQQLAQPAVEYECDSIDVRNDCSNLLYLQNCTVIRGYLMIVLLPRRSSKLNDTCDYSTFKFPALREITDYLIFFDVKGLTTIRDLFPSLTVIRGRRLFLNYALGATGMPELEMIEFRSLVAIQRGHVFVGSCPKLCQLEKINWDRLTLTPGENHIYPVTSNACPSNAHCINCATEYCWSNLVCQKFENDNVINQSIQGSFGCHAECLGGCYNSTNTGCVVCKGITDHGMCLRQCPSEKYYLEHYQRCYSEKECIEEQGRFIYESMCVAECPGGFMINNMSHCEPCTSTNDDCLKVCQPRDSAFINVFNLADVEYIKGCQVVNASLILTIRNKVNEVDLFKSFGDIREIRGHLKIYRSPYLSSLKFLRNLEKISGEPLENDHYAFVVYDNKQLRELWDPKHCHLQRGSMFVHLNNKLCNGHLKDFRDKLEHNRSLDSLQVNDQEVLCDPEILTLQVEIISHRALKFSWRKDRTSEEIEVLYRPSEQTSKEFLERSELDSNICTRIDWQRQLVFKSDLQENGTHYSYSIGNLEPNTKYGCLIKSFGTAKQNEARSELVFVTTKVNKPTAPSITVTKSTDSSISGRLNQLDRTNETITHYMLEVYEFVDDQDSLDRRDYCQQPAMPYATYAVEGFALNSPTEDYDECCTRQEEAAEDALFMQNMLSEVGCSLDRAENCVGTSSVGQQRKTPLQRLQLKSDQTAFTLHNLGRYRLYLLQAQACNEIGCGSFGMHSERTNYSSAGDILNDLWACQVPHSTEYRVYFSEPKHPNGMIVSYAVHFRLYLPGAAANYSSHMNCVTRKQHAQSHYKYLTHLNASFNEVAVRVHSLAGNIFNDWVNVSLCRSGSTTLMAGVGIVGESPSHGLNVFFVFFLIGAGGTILWICYKRRYWRKLFEIRRNLPIVRHWRVRSDNSIEDRQILVDGFETVRFHNNHNDDQKYLE